VAAVIAFQCVILRRYWDRAGQKVDAFALLEAEVLNAPLPRPSQLDAAVGALPRSVRIARVLLVIQAGLLFLDTWNAAIVAAVLQPGMGPSPPERLLILVIVGGGFATLDVVCFVEMRKPSRGIWWASLGILPLAALHIGTLIALIPEDAIGVSMVIDIYLVSGLMTVVILAALLTRKARRYFWST